MRARRDEAKGSRTHKSALVLPVSAPRTPKSGAGNKVNERRRDRAGPASSHEGRTAFPPGRDAVGSWGRISVGAGWDGAGRYQVSGGAWLTGPVGRD